MGNIIKYNKPILNNQNQYINKKGVISNTKKIYNRRGRKSSLGGSIDSTFDRLPAYSINSFESRSYGKRKSRKSNKVKYRKNK